MHLPRSQSKVQCLDRQTYRAEKAVADVGGAVKRKKGHGKLVLFCLFSMVIAVFDGAC